MTVISSRPRPSTSDHTRWLEDVIILLNVEVFLNAQEEAMFVAAAVALCSEAENLPPNPAVDAAIDMLDRAIDMLAMPQNSVMLSVYQLQQAKVLGP